MIITKNKMRTSDNKPLKQSNITITRNLLKQRFTEYNNSYFDGKLSMPQFYFLMSKRPYGRCVRYRKDGKRAVDIWMSKRIDWTEDFFKEVLIHEMIHQYVYEVFFRWRYSFIQHGLFFHYMRWKLYRKYGLKIR